jgi:hypothetical protein
MIGRCSRWLVVLGVLGGNLALAVVACLGEDPDLTNVNVNADAGRSDSTSDGKGSTTDAPRRCNRADAFEQANLLGGVNDGANLFHPRLTPDEKEIFYQRGTTAIYHATRPDRTLSFSAGSPVPFGDAAAVLEDPSITGNTLVLYVSINYRLARMSRPSRIAAFGSPASLDLGTPAGVQDSDPHSLANESALYFTRYDPDGGQTEIWRAQGDGDGGFTAPAAVPLGPDAFHSAFVSEDELEIYVAHGPTRSVYRATRDSDAGPFSTPTSVDDINAQAQLNGNVRPAWLSLDGCRLYLTAGATNSRIWVAERKPR